MSHNDLAENIISLSKSWNAVISSPENLGVPNGYPPRNASQPNYADVPEAIKDEVWNISQADLLEKAADIMTYRSNIAGVEQPPIVIKKQFDANQKPIAFSGMPETGLIGPGVLGKGQYDGKPSPITRAADVILLTQDKASGELSCFLGKRPEYCFPGGFVDEGENPVYTAVREFFEEVLVASYDLGENANEFLQGRDWSELSKEEKEQLCGILNVPNAYAKEPFMAEFKYKVLSAKQPEAIEDITKYLKSLAHESFAGLVSADPRICGRAIYTNAFSLVIDEKDLSDILVKHGLSMAEESSEIGKLGPVKITPETLIGNYKDSGSQGMYASHGPLLLYALAHQIKLGNIDPSLASAGCQIAQVCRAVEEYVAGYVPKFQNKPAPKANP